MLAALASSVEDACVSVCVCLSICLSILQKLQPALPSTVIDYLLLSQEFELWLVVFMKGGKKIQFYLIKCAAQQTGHGAASCLTAVH